jgi:hypothetical protein
MPDADIAMTTDEDLFALFPVCSLPLTVMMSELKLGAGKCTSGGYRWCAREVAA